MSLCRVACAVCGGTDACPLSQVKKGIMDLKRKLMDVGKKKDEL